MKKKLLQWKNEVWPIEKVWPWEGNPRIFTDKGMSDLKNSVDKFGVMQQLVINTDGMIIGGHARFKDYQERGFAEVEARVPERTLSMDECQQANVRLNANIAGVFDFEVLKGWDIDEKLDEWGLEIERNEGNGVEDVNETFELAQDLGIEREYVVIVFNTNDEYETAKIKLNLKPQMDQGKKKALDLRMQRVMNYEDLHSLLK